MKDVKIECAVAKIWGVTLVILIGAVFSFAAWDGKTKTEPSIRIIDGRQFYQIGTPEELAWFANKVNSKDTALSAVLTADIDLNSKTWIPIGDTTSHAYDGVFDGNGFSIRGVSVSNKSYAGLFGVIDLGVVKNLTIEKSSIQGSFPKNGASYVGGIAGYANKGSLIQNATNKASLLGPTANLGSILYLGGIVGFSKGSIKNCTNDADIALTSSYSKKSRLGGIAGTCDKSSTDTLKDLKNNGSIMGGAYVGGIVGDGFEGQSRIINAENYGIVSGGVNVGGVCGQRCFVQNGENRGNIVISDGSANMYVGGIVGFWGSELGSLNYGEINIVSDSGTYVGGVDGCPFYINYSGNYGAINVVSKKGVAYAGGVAGNLEKNISSVFNQGKIRSSHYAAGIVSYLPQKDVVVENFYVATDSIKALYSAAVVNYSSVNATIKNGFVDTTLLSPISIVGENLGKQENILFMSASNMQTDSFAYHLDLYECQKQGCLKGTFYDSVSYALKKHWSREDGYPIFVDSAHNPIYKVRFVIHQDTAEIFTNANSSIKHFPSVQTTDFIGWYKFGNFYTTKRDLITSDYLFRWQDSLVLAAYKGSEEKARVDAAYCIDYMFDFQKDYSDTYKAYYEKNNMVWPSYDTESVQTRDCLDDNNDGILNWDDPTSTEYTKTMRDALARIKESMGTTSIVNGFYKENLQVSNRMPKTIYISGAQIGSPYVVLDVRGRVVQKNSVKMSNFSVVVPRVGFYIVRIGSQIGQVDVK